jgi:hypothetical protein
MSARELFYTRGPANDGLKLNLFDPRDGKETAHWIRILGRDSDAFRAASDASLRRVREKAPELSGDKKSLARQLEAMWEDEERKLISSLVVEWSFDEPCTHEAVNEFLREAPQIADRINEVAGKRALFLAHALKNSPPTPDTNSGSSAESKEANKPGDSV